MNNITQIPLVSSEISSIWTSYIGENLFSSIMKSFLGNVNDDETRSILESTLALSKTRIETLTSLLRQENLPIPDGFSDNDINLSVPRLFTDSFYLQYLIYASRVGIQNYAVFLCQLSRPDIRDTFSKFINEYTSLYNNVTELCLSRGIFVRAPFVEVSKKVEYAKNENPILNWFGKKRPLLTNEITDIITNVYASEVRKMMLTGFSQVCKHKPLNELILKGITLATEHNKVFASLLNNEDIKIPTFSPPYVTDSTISPFSDKLIVNKVILMCSVKISNLGMGLANARRADLLDVYLKCTNDIMKYAKDGMAIMIDNKWLEQPPQAIKHEDLVRI